jgi:hypothetical protein
MRARARGIVSFAAVLSLTAFGALAVACNGDDDAGNGADNGAGAGPPPAGDSPWAARVNGHEISEGDIEWEQGVRERQNALLPEGFPFVAPTDRDTVLEELIDERLLDEEAERQGQTCTDDEALAIYRDRRAAAFDIDGQLAPVVAGGFAPDGYLETPEAERTPDPEELIAEYYETDWVVADLVRECQRQKLYDSVLSGAEGPDPDAAFEELKQELRDGAEIEYAAA